jgi:hypothetical protein
MGSVWAPGFACRRGVRRQIPRGCSIFAGDRGEYLGSKKFSTGDFPFGMGAGSFLGIAIAPDALAHRECEIPSHPRIIAHPARFYKVELLIYCERVQEIPVPPIQFQHSMRMARKRTGILRKGLRGMTNGSASVPM